MPSLFPYGFLCKSTCNNFSISDQLCQGECITLTNNSTGNPRVLNGHFKTEHLKLTMVLILDRFALTPGTYTITLNVSNTLEAAKRLRL